MKTHMQAEVEEIPAAAARFLSESREQVIALARNSLEASFVSEARRAELLAELAAVAAA